MKILRHGSLQMTFMNMCTKSQEFSLIIKQNILVKKNMRKKK